MKLKLHCLKLQLAAGFAPLRAVCLEAPLPLGFERPNMELT
jgi:hypothetical protein